MKNQDTDKTLLITQIAEIFRECGFAGTSLSRITGRTGLGKGSLYHFFPAGKNEMAATVLANVDGWFAVHIFQPLELGAPREAIEVMWRAVDDYFRSGQRICLLGAFALDDTRDRFAPAINAYFTRWIAALRQTCVRGGIDGRTAAALAEETVAGIQGALTLARGLNDGAFFGRSLQRLRLRIDRAWP
ncbi:TetR/AcrR family transcriptional regulator [Sodalis sp. RH21]|uniref:TetR/AcrR family transcriptional regulator n=1 Tax=unclassified Sodalis (in: enterobacteria) TaxID=2636512 RepID=UPI0039B6C88C